MADKMELAEIIKEKKGVNEVVEEVRGLINSLLGFRFMDKSFIDFLEKGGYFTDPASTQYHSSFKGGLAYHSYLVYKILKRKESIYRFGLGEDSIIITSLFHDLCKMGTYGGERRWRKDSEGKWEPYCVVAYKNEPTLGHGEKSVILLQQFMVLKEVEMYMIRWHMGWSESRENWGLFQNSLKKFPEIVALITADIEAAFIYEPIKDNEISLNEDG